MSFVKEFKEFISRGNVVDLAVAIIIGAAFGKVVTSAVNDIIMPPLGFVLGGINFTDIKIILKHAVIENGVKVKDAVSLNIGNFLQAIFDFIIIAFAVFMMIKTINKMKRKREVQEAAAIEASHSKEQELLTEIRDILKNK